MLEVCALPLPHPAVLRTVAGVLHLGNVAFSDNNRRVWGLWLGLCASGVRAGLIQNP